MNYKYINTLLQVAKRRKAQLSTSKINKSEDAKFLRYLAFLLETDSNLIFFKNMREVSIRGLFCWHTGEFNY